MPTNPTHNSDSPRHTCIIAVESACNRSTLPATPEEATDARSTSHAAEKDADEAYTLRAAEETLEEITDSAPAATTRLPVSAKPPEGTSTPGDATVSPLVVTRRPLVYTVARPSVATCTKNTQAQDITSRNESASAIARSKNSTGAGQNKAPLESEHKVLAVQYAQTVQESLHTSNSVLAPSIIRSAVDVVPNCVLPMIALPVNDVTDAYTSTPDCACGEARDSVPEVPTRLPCIMTPPAKTVKPEANTVMPPVVTCHPAPYSAETQPLDRTCQSTISSQNCHHTID